jgi:hypothetical protein
LIITPPLYSLSIFNVFPSFRTFHIYSLHNFSFACGSIWV